MKQKLKDALTNPWLRRYILIGYGAKGIIYLLIGILAIQAVTISNREASGTYLTLAFIASQPLGKFLVCLLAIALMGYVLRRLLQAILMPGHANSWSIKSIFQRLGYIMSGLSYAGIAYSGLNIIFELGEYDDTIEDLADQLFEQPIGEWLIFLGGIVVITIGISYVYGAYSGSYISEFESFDTPHQLEKWAIIIGKLGVAARGVSFILTGVFIIQAAIFSDSELAGGLQNAFRVLADQPFGGLWLGLIGVGFICYGLYLFVSVKYRRYVIR